MSSESIKEFNQKGYVLVRNLIGASEIDEYKEQIELATKQRKKLDKRTLKDKSEYEQSFIQCQNLWEDFPEIRKLAFHKKITSTAAKLLGVETIRIWHDQALIKEPGGRETDIHHDKPYWPIKENKTITAWIPLVEVNENNGQLGFFPGSHLDENERFINIFSGKVSTEELSEVTQINEIQPEYLSLMPGDVSFHNGLTFHQAKQNKSDKERLVYTVIFFADGCTRGDDRFHFSVDRSEIKVGEKIDSDVTPIAFPINNIPDRPKKDISESFSFLKETGLLPADR